MGMQDDPLQLATSYFLPEVSRRIPQLAEPDTGPVGCTREWRTPATNSATRRSSVSAYPHPRSHRVTANHWNPLLTIIRVAYDEDDRSVEVCDTRLASDCYELSYDVALMVVRSATCWKLKMSNPSNHLLRARAAFSPHGGESARRGDGAVRGGGSSRACLMGDVLRCDHAPAMLREAAGFIR